MQSHLIPVARKFVTEWKTVRGEFDRLISPKMDALHAVEVLENGIAIQEEESEIQISAVERRLDENGAYLQAKDEAGVAEKRYRDIRQKHGNRSTVMWGTTFTYWLCLAVIGSTEWLINFDFFRLFVGIPAVAAGGTLLVWAAVTFSAHGCGTVFRQWNYRFAPHQEMSERHSSWRLLWFSIICVVTVLVVAGASRFVVAQQIAVRQQPNILGSEASIDNSLIESVLTSLIFNLLAWLVGVGVAYFAHDQDPDYMDATRQHRKAQKPYQRIRRRAEEEIKTIRAKFEKSVAESRRQAQVIASEVGPERDLMRQVNSHEQQLLGAGAAALTNSIGGYRNILIRVVQEKNPQLQIFKSDTQQAISATVFGDLPLRIDAHFLRELA